MGRGRGVRRVACDHSYLHLCDVLAEDLGLRDLRVTEVHHLVEQLVGDDEVVTDRLLLEFLKVVLEDLQKS